MRPEPLSPYAAAKLAGEHYARVFNEVYGLDTFSLRYFNVFGPRRTRRRNIPESSRDSSTRSMKGESPVVYGDGEQSLTSRTLRTWWTRILRPWRRLAVPVK